MNDLIIINSYTPDYEREELLRKFINQIDKTNFDIMIVSHSRLPDDLYEKVDYFIFDKENEILTDIESKYDSWWGNESFEIHTTEARQFNHSVAAYKLFFIGINNAKMIGYKKVHIIEYDTSLNNMSHFINNSKLLDNHSVIYYKTNYTPALISFPMSFNVDKLNEEWFKSQKHKIINDKYKTLEDLEILLIKQQQDTYHKSHKTLKDGSIKINLYNSFGEEIWACPVVDESNNLILFVNNKNEKELKVKVVINENTIKNLVTKPNQWSILRLSNYEHTNKLLIIKQDKHIVEYDFTKIDKDRYKIKNHIVSKK
jgi:hypothetical protein